MCEGQEDGIRRGQGDDVIIVFETPSDMAKKQAEVLALDKASGIADIPVTDEVAKALEEGSLPK